MIKVYFFYSPLFELKATILVYWSLRFTTTTCFWLFDVEEFVCFVSECRSSSRWRVLTYNGLFRIRWNGMAPKFASSFSNDGCNSWFCAAASVCPPDTFTHYDDNRFFVAADGELVPELNRVQPVIAAMVRADKRSFQCRMWPRCWSLQLRFAIGVIAFCWVQVSVSLTLRTKRRVNERGCIKNDGFYVPVGQSGLMHCVKGKAQSSPHLKSAGCKLPKIAWGQLLSWQEGGQQHAHSWCGTQRCFSATLPCKGLEHQ